MARSDLPFGSEFSPAQIDLAVLLELAHEHASDWRAFEDAVRVRYFADRPTSDANKRKLANNTKLSLRAYGIIETDDATLTPFGRSLYAARSSEAELYEALARHILRECQGAAFVQCIMDMQSAGDRITLISLRQRLEATGIVVPRGGKHMSTMRLWLERAGVFVTNYRVDLGRFEEILGVTPEEIEVLATFSLEQRAYLKALANIGGGGPHLSNEVEQLAAAVYGGDFNEKNLPKQVLYPLRDAGYITLVRGTGQGGRGAKPFLVTATDRLDLDIIAPLLEQIDQQVIPDIRPLLRRSLADIRAEIDTPDDHHRRGLALEALAFKLMQSIDLKYVGTRVRGKDTGGAEVDLIFDSDRLVFSRWQIQCKNTRRVRLDDVAKEVGLTHFLKSNAVLIVTTGSISDDARAYANSIMRDMNLCVVMIDGSDLDVIERRPAAIVDVLNREARHAMRLKRLEL